MKRIARNKYQTEDGETITFAITWVQTPSRSARLNGRPQPTQGFSFKTFANVTSVYRALVRGGYRPGGQGQVTIRISGSAGGSDTVQMVQQQGELSDAEGFVFLPR